MNTETKFLNTDEEIGDCIDFALADDISELAEIVNELKFLRKKLESKVTMNCADLTKARDYEDARAAVASLKEAQNRLKEKLAETMERTNGLYDLFTMQLDSFSENGCGF